MKTVRKFSLALESNGYVTVRMPAGARVLHAGEQHGGLFVWALVYFDTAAELVTRRFRVAATGYPILDVDTETFVGTAAIGSLVFHVFDCGVAE